MNSTLVIERSQVALHLGVLAKPFPPQKPWHYFGKALTQVGSFAARQQTSPAPFTRQHHSALTLLRYSLSFVSSSSSSAESSLVPCLRHASTCHSRPRPWTPYIFPVPRAPLACKTNNDLLRLLLNLRAVYAVNDFQFSCCCQG